MVSDNDRLIKDQVWKVSRLLRARGGAKRSADLVEFYVDVVVIMVFHFFCIMNVAGYRV